MNKGRWMLVTAVLVAMAVLAGIPLTAGADETGRSVDAEPGAAVDAGDGGTVEEDIGENDWDGDGPAPRPFIGVVGNNSIDGSLCVGFDCVANEAFGFDTIRLKENNLRIHFQDTSTAAAFPTRDWRIVINSGANGGEDFFTINDVDAGFDAFRISGDSLNNALTIDAQGDIGIGRANAPLDLSIQRGDTPSIRLEQDGSSGFTAQTWDVAGNEAGFFVRDATSGSTLPFRIRTGVASSALDVHSDGIGFFNSNPDEPLHLKQSGTEGADLKLEQTGTGSANIRMEVADAGVEWVISLNGSTGEIRFSLVGSGSQELILDTSGNLTVLGDVCADNVAGTC